MESTIQSFSGILQAVEESPIASIESSLQYLPEILQAVGESPIALATLTFVLLAVLASILFANSKGWARVFAFFALLAFAFFLVFTFNKASSPASDPVSENQTTNPLQVGEYTSDNYKYHLFVFQRGDRICVKNMSINGFAVMSVHVDPNNLNSYKGNQYSGWKSFEQLDPTTISFGEYIYTKDESQGFPQNFSDVEECLDSKSDFFEHTSLNSGEGG